MDKVIIGYSKTLESFIAKGKVPADVLGPCLSLTHYLLLAGATGEAMQLNLQFTRASWPMPHIETLQQKYAKADKIRVFLSADIKGLRMQLEVFFYGLCCVKSNFQYYLRASVSMLGTTIAEVLERP